MVVDSVAQGRKQGREEALEDFVAVAPEPACHLVRLGDGLGGDGERHLIVLYLHGADVKKSTAREGGSLIIPVITPRLSQTVDASDLLTLPAID
jgi:hypothetical protein